MMYVWYEKYVRNSDEIALVEYLISGLDPNVEMQVGNAKHVVGSKFAGCETIDYIVDGVSVTDEQLVIAALEFLRSPEFIASEKVEDIIWGII